MDRGILSTCYAEPTGEFKGDSLLDVLRDFYKDEPFVRVSQSLPATKHGLRFHDLRHTCASLLIAQGAHPKLIQARLGHSSITITLDRYGHLFPSLEAALADKLDAAFAAGTEPVAAVAELGR